MNTSIHRLVYYGHSHCTLNIIGHVFLCIQYMKIVDQLSFVYNFLLYLLIFFFFKNFENPYVLRISLANYTCIVFPSPYNHKHTRSVLKVSSHIIWKIETFIEEDTRYKKHAHRTMTPQSPSQQAPWDLTQFSQSPSVVLWYFTESHHWSEIPPLSKVILILGKARSCSMPNLGCRVAESPGCFDGSPKSSA